MLSREEFEANEQVQRLRALEQDSEEWAKARREEVKLSASEIAAVTGHPKASYSRAALWHYKKGHTESPGGTPSAYVQKLFDHGKEMEPAALDFFARSLRPHARVEKTGIWLLRQDPRIGATPDAKVTEANGMVVPLEIKCPYRDAYVPCPQRESKDLLQLQTQMEAMEAPYGYLLYYWSPTQYSLIVKRRNSEHWAAIYWRAWVFLDYAQHDEEPPRATAAQIKKERERFESAHPTAK